MKLTYLFRIFTYCCFPSSVLIIHLKLFIRTNYQISYYVANSKATNLAKDFFFHWSWYIKLLTDTCIGNNTLPWYGNILSPVATCCEKDPNWVWTSACNSVTLNDQSHLVDWVARWTCLFMTTQVAIFFSPTPQDPPNTAYGSNTVCHPKCGWLLQHSMSVIWQIKMVHSDKLQP